MTDIWELLKKMDCEECSLHDECDNKNLCAEWITKAEPELLRLKKEADRLPLIEAHRDRLWKAMGEIEERMNAHQKQLTGLYKQKLWIPIAEKKKTDVRSQPEFFDGLADYIEFLRPIILGAK